MERAALKKLVPHGYGQIIADKAGVNRMTVSQFLNGKNDNVLVELATLEVVAELADKKQGFLKRIAQTA